VSARLCRLLRDEVEKGAPKHRRAFAEFLEGLRENINPSITKDDAIEMLSQHIITRPVFDALFKNYAFTKENPVSVAMQAMLNTLEDQSLEKETERLATFYDSVRKKASDIDNAEGRQKVVIELYEKFFKTAFKKMTDRLGIVYTPVEIVDFIVRSVDEVLREEFSSSLAQKDVHIIDPFTGTGTFIVRLLQSGLIPPSDLRRKYTAELHANEIVLLAYYIAAINIEETYHSLCRAESAASNGGGDKYEAFKGIVLTDTFQLAEKKGEERMFPENNRRVQRQKQAPIRVVIANPPYSVGQTKETDENENLEYPRLDAGIAATYAARSRAGLVRNVYDSYVRAIRWASDHIGERGVVGFVTNNSFIDGNALDGLRASLADEFSSIYIFNLRGNQRTSGEVSRMEGGKVFGAGSRAGIAISVLVKNPHKRAECTIYYHDIGDYLRREEKLAIISRFASIGGIRREGKWVRLHPNKDHDWINQRDPAFESFVPLGDKDDASSRAVFTNYSLGVVTNRDTWAYNATRAVLESNLRGMIAFYNEQRKRYQRACQDRAKDECPEVEDVVDKDPKRIGWTHLLKTDVKRDRELEFEPASMTLAMYRPFSKQWLYFNRRLNERVYQMPKLFPTKGHENIVICTTGVGNRVGFSALITNLVPDLHMVDASGGSQCFPLYLYEKEEASEGRLFADRSASEVVDGYRRSSAITEALRADFRSAYGSKVSDEDVFYYVYGVLHSAEYRSRFGSDLKKMLPRVPLTKEAADFWKFSKAGRALADLHLKYESVEPYPVKESSDVLRFDVNKDYLVQKMTFGRKSKEIDKTTIIYNSHITLSGIPLEAYEYVVNGKSAIEWIMERYQVTRDKDSGIANDPNDWAREHKEPRYILDLVKRIVRVSVETMKIVKGLPPLNESLPYPKVPEPVLLKVAETIPPSV
jgi:predicted helicase